MIKYLKLCIALCLIWSGACLAEYKPSTTYVNFVNHIHINADASSTETSEVQKRVNTQQAIRGLGEQKISYVSTLETVEVEDAYTIRPDGTKIQVAKDKIRVQDESDSDGSSIYSDQKVLTIIFPNVEVGGQIYYKVRSHQHTPVFPGYFGWMAHFSPHTAIENYKVHLTHDAAIDVRYHLKGATGGRVANNPEDAANVKRYQFEYTQSFAHPGESNRVALSDFAPHILVSTYKDYKQIGLAYQAGAHPKSKPTPTIEKLAAEIVGSETDELKKARMVYNWVSRNIRYVGVYVAAGGFIPHDAQSILDNRYGDCKDHVVILESLLTALNIESSPALINSGDAYELKPIGLTSPFNHVITYLPKYKLFLDSTHPFAPFGLLDDDVMDKPVVITASGEISKTPKTNPSNEFATVDTKLKLHSDGRVTGKSTARMHGYLETASRATQFGYENKDQEQIVNDLLERFQERGVGQIKASAPKELDEPWKVDSTFELKPVVNVPGPSAMTIPVGIAPGYLMTISKSGAPLARKFPSTCRSIRYEEKTLLEFPADTRIQRIPKNVSHSVGSIRYSAKYKLTANRLMVTREYVSDRPKSVCSSADDKDWNELAEVMRHDMRNQIFFR